MRDSNAPCIGFQLIAEHHTYIQSHQGNIFKVAKSTTAMFMEGRNTVCFSLYPCTNRFALLKHHQNKASESYEKKTEVKFLCRASHQF